MPTKEYAGSMLTPAQWDEEHDVVVLGAGLAGFEGVFAAIAGPTAMLSISRHQRVSMPARPLSGSDFMGFSYPSRVFHRADAMVDVSVEDVQ